MTITVESNGLEFSFPDGTTVNQIGEAIAEYTAKKQPPKTGWIDDAWGGLKRGTVELAENYADKMGGWAFQMLNPGAAVEHPQVAKMARETDDLHPFSAGMTAPQTIVGEVASFAPELAASVPGWEFGAESMLESLGEREMPWLVKAMAKNAAGTIGGDFTSGEDVTPSGVLAGTLFGAGTEGLLGIPKMFRPTAIRKAEADAVSLAAADRVGITPTMGMIVDDPAVATLEQGLSKEIGGKVINLAHDKALEGADSYWKQLKGGEDFASNPNELGQEIESAVKEYKTGFEKEAEELYDTALEKVGKYQKINTRRFTRLIEEMNGVNPKDGIQQMTVPPIARKYFDLIDKAGKVPQNNGYSNVVMGLGEARNALKILDDYIGTGESAAADTAAAKRMAKALRGDITMAMGALGAGGEWAAANSHYAAGKALYEQALSGLAMKKDADVVYTSLFGSPSGEMTALGAGRAKGLVNGLSPDVWVKVRAEIIHRMGVTPASHADVGEGFSPVRFMKNYNKLAKNGSLDVIFDAQQQEDLATLAEVSKMMKRIGLHDNHSNTAHHMAMRGWLDGSFKHAVDGRLVKAALTLFGQPALTKSTALLLTNPEAARSLASAASAVGETEFKRRAAKFMAIVAANQDVRDELSKELQKENNQ